ncbi:MAG: hypothetical protein WD042_03535 [Phycisphaeraceae bacterium]
MKRLIKLAGMGMLAAGLGLGMPGCRIGETGGVSRVRDEPPATTEYRTDLEMVTDAQLVRADTNPRSDNGRGAFRPGSNQLLVLTHIASAISGVRQDLPGVTKGERGDFIKERLWISIAYGTKLGEQLDAEEQMWKHNVVYDSGLVAGDDAGLFMQPYTVKGKLQLVEDRPESSVVYVNVVIKPKDMSDWAVNGTFEVPKTKRGIHATPLAPPPVEMYRQGADVEQVTPEATPVKDPKPDMEHVPPTRTGGPPAEIEKTDPEAPTPPEFAPRDQSEAPTTQAAGTAPDPDKEKAAQGALTGKWISQNAAWYDRFQFNPDGTFIRADCRVNYPPAIYTGNWEVKGDYMVMTTRKFTFGDVSQKNIDQDLPKTHIGLLRFTFQDKQLTLEGTGFMREGEKKLKFTLKPADFDDMSIVPPPSKW